GFTREEMVKRVAEVRQIAKTKRKVTPKLSANAYAAASKAATIPPIFREDARSIEGFLFPATYEFTPRTTAKRLVADQLDFFDANWNKVDLRYARSKQLTPYDVLIIASMVEKETVAPDERPKVAAVIYNRLKLGMPLGIDATIRYGLKVPGTEPLRVSHLESDNPYNTRNRQGLPPTPIGNPGLASMQAAAHPADVDFLFFVRKPDKIHHFFTASETEFYAKACEYGYGCG
ncbi:MAG: endolytic transglycosylase MltG, partial [Gaiellaceae bacterium]